MVFAAHPKVVCPLTTDYNHVRSALEEIDGDHPPHECRPGVAEDISGTRIGAALTEAVNLHDKRFPGYQDIVLFSDGDDPGEEDKEWRQGSDSSGANGIPVHTVGIGNPDEPRGLPSEANWSARGFEAVAEADRQRDARSIIPARTHPPQLGDFFRTQLEPLPSRKSVTIRSPCHANATFGSSPPAIGLLMIGWLRGR